MSNIKVRERVPRNLEQAPGAPSRKPELHTHWARDDVNRIRQMERDGYRMATPDDVKEGHQGRFDSVDNLIRDGDLVLMVASREVPEGHRKKITVKADATHKHTEDGIREQLEAGGQVQVTSDPVHNYEIVRGKKRRT